MRDLEQILAQCLDDVHSGRASIEDCLQRYPAWHEELEPLLRLALRLPPLPDVQPSQEFRLRARRALEEEIARPRILSGLRQGLAKTFRPGLRVRPRLATPVFAALLIAAVLLGGGGGVAYASQESLPGDLLYPVKTATERGRLLVRFSSAGKAEYHLELAQRRLKEVLSLARAGRSINPDTVEAIASQVDAALAQVRRISSQDAQAILSEFSANIAKQRGALANIKQQAAPEAIQPLAQAELLVQRGQLITKALSEDPARLAVPLSVRTAREGKLKGPILSLDPLRIAGLGIVVPPDAKVKGTLMVGRVATVKGTFLEDGTLRASRIEIEEGEEPTRVELTGVIAGLDPLTVAGQIVVLTRDAEVEGVPRIGLIADIEGQLQVDGSVLASKLKVERLKEETKLRGPVNALEPLTVGASIIVLAPGAEVEGVLRIGVEAEVEGRFLDDGRFLASEIEVSEDREEEEEARFEVAPDQRVRDGKETEIEGVIMDIVGDKIIVETERGQRFTVRVIDQTRLWLDDSRSELGDLQVGVRVEIRFNPTTGIAVEIEQED